MPFGPLTDPTPGENIDALDTRPGELGTGHIAFGAVPYDLSDELCEEEFNERLKREKKRIPLGFR